MFETWLSGLGIGAGLIVAIGAQNAFVLRQGIRRQHVGVAVAICMLGDILLVTLGAVGLGVVVEKMPQLITVMRWLGAAYLIWFGVQSLRSARTAQGLQITETDELSPADPGDAAQVISPSESAGAGGSIAVKTKAPTTSRRSAAMGALAITFLNPHVYLDTVVFLGSIAQQHASPMMFAAGAITASTLWFSVLGFAAHLLAKPLARPRVWQVIDVVVAIMMFSIAAMLILNGNPGS